MKSIKTKLLIIIGMILVVCSTILIQRTYTSASSCVGNLTNQQLNLALDFDLAIREYVAETIRPIMFNMVDNGEFIPETMSTSYVSRKIFEKVNKKYPEYIIKFASGNPRNPLNQAGPEELEIIKYFNDNPGNSVWTGNIAMDGKEYFAAFSAMRMEKDCLRCHGKPKDAPIELINRYGSDASFYRPFGKVVGMDTIAIPSKTVNKLLTIERFKNLGILGIVILLLCVSFVFALKFTITDRLTRITNHILNAEEQSEKIKLKQVEIHGRDEIALLAESFNKLSKKLNKIYIELTLEIERRKQIQKKMQESEEKYRKLFELESDALALVDLETEMVIETNQAFINLYGYSKDEISRMKIKDFSAEPEETSKAVKDRRTFIPLRYHKKKDGTTFPVEITANSFEYKGKNVYIAAIRDITDRKTIEEQIEASFKDKEILLSEIHHRVKNNFEIISSLLDMSSMTTDNQEIRHLLLSSRTRIHSMAMIHSQLYQSERFDQIDMVKHVNELAEHLLVLYGSEKKITIVTEPSNVYLSLRQAIPCALIFNELITNSLKYAFVGRAQGKIKISIHQSDDNDVLLRVRDDGIGISQGEDINPSGGLGLELIKHLVTGQLKGTVQFDNNEGTDVCITFNT